MRTYKAEWGVEKKNRKMKRHEQETHVLEAPGAGVPDGPIELVGATATTEVKVGVPPPAVVLNDG